MPAMGSTSFVAGMARSYSRARVGGVARADMT